MKTYLVLLVALALTADASSLDKQFSCPEPSGFFPHALDCTAFYHCEEGQATLKQCSTLLHFNPVINDCDWPISDKCEPGEYDNVVGYSSNQKAGVPYTGSGVVCPDDVCYCAIPNPSDCTTYYRCVKGQPFLRTCAEGLYFNPETQVCDHKANVKCSVTTTKAPTTTTKAPTTTTKAPTTTTKAPTTTTEKPGVCKEVNGLYPDPESCRHFYHCSNGVPHRKICPANLHFNPKLLVCDWPDRAGCGDPTGPELPVVDGECSCDCCVETDWKDCSRYFLCIGKKRHHMTCSDGLFFNHMTENCDLRENLDRWCPEKTTKSPPVTPPKRTTTKRPTTTTKAPVPPTARPPTPVTSRPGFKCPDVNGLYPDPENCRYFYHCSNDIPYHKICPSNLHFNPNLLVCDWPDKAGCGGIVNPPTRPPPEGNCDCDCCLQTDWNDCSKYYLCLEGQKHHLSCSEGLFFNHKTETCDRKENLDRWCPDPTSPRPPPPTPSPTCKDPSGLYPHPTDCTKFIHCAHGIEHVKDCPKPLHWSIDRTRCEWPCIARCDPSVKPCDDTTPATRPTPTPSRQTPTPSRPTPTPSRPTPTPSTECPDGDGLFPTPGDCGSYHWCLEGVKKVMRCPAGLHFNRITRVCDQPDNAGCAEVPETPIGKCSCKCCLLPDDCDCNRFFLCLNGELFHKECGKGLVFDPIEQTCNFPANIDRTCPPVHIPTFKPVPVTKPTVGTTVATVPTSSSVCLDPEGLYPHPEDCTKFIHCAHGKEHIKDCPKPLHWSIAIGRCEWPCIAKCDPTVPPCRDTTPHTVTPTTPRPVVTSSPVCVDPEGLYPHPTDCGKFIHCAHGIEHVKDCPKPLHWSVAIGRCEWPCIAKCDPSVKPCPTTTTTTTTEKPVDVVTNSPVCVDPEGLYPHSTDCGKFIHCAHGIEHVKDCPKPLHWSIGRTRCEWPCIAKCDPNVRPCTTIKDEEVTPPTPGVGCPCLDCLLPDPSDCSSYFKCKDGKPQTTKCPSGQLFDRTSKRCAPKETVKCANVGDPELCPRPEGLYPLPGRCNQYVHCQNGVANIMDCPANTEFNPDIEVCDWPSGKCGDNTVDKRCPKPTGLFPHPKDCDKFLHCDHGIAYVKDCPKPLHFNRKLKVCDWPRNVNCDDPGNNNDDPNEDDNFVWGCKETSGIVCPSCACRIPNYDSCTAFYQCTTEGKACAKTCPKGLNFNRKTRVCDVPENAVCTAP